MDDSRLIFLFNKYLEKTCTPQELTELVDLLQHAEANEQLNGPLEALWQQLKTEAPANKVDWDSMYAAVSSQPEDNILTLRSKKPAGNTWLYAAAASLLFLISIAAVYKYSQHTAVIDKPLAIVQTDSLLHASTRQTIHLPDGSTVILNSNSKLDYPAAFTGNTREVYITGEAFFDIAHKPSQPFIVHAGNVTTKVLGTAFNIRAYPNDEKVQVTVLRGKVQVVENNKTLGTLTASQQLSVNKETEEFTQQQIDTKQVIAWKPKEILFDNITMQEAAEQMKQRFNISIEFTNEAIKNCRVSATFSEDDLPEEMLTVICTVANAHYSISNNKISIDGKGCN